MTEIAEITTPEEDIQLELFEGSIIGAGLKSEMDSMEHPFFSLTKQKDMSEFRYESPNGHWVEIKPSSIGRATIFDKDLLLYCVGQIIEGKNKGLPVSRRISIVINEYLTATRKHNGGKQYKAFYESLNRLRGTTINTNIKNGNISETRIFGFIDNASIVRKNGRVSDIEIVLSEELFESITEKNVLTYHPLYFALKSSIERRLYENCRKHCGRQAKWEIGLEKLKAKVGSLSPMKEFKRKVKRACEKQEIPNYYIELVDKNSKTYFVARYISSV